MATLANPGARGPVGRMIQRRPTIDRKPFIRIAPLLALFYVIFVLPPEASITIAGVWLPAYRLVVIGCILVAVPRMIGREAKRLNATDAMIIAVAIWIIMSFISIYDVSQGIVRGAGVVLDVLGSYILARVSITSFRDLRLFLILVLPALGFASLVMALESLSGTLFYRPTFGSIFGGVSSYSGGEAIGQISLRAETRLGLLRAYGPFSHPILGGLMLGIFLPLFFFSGIRSWPRMAGLGAALAGVFSLSSAALLGMLIFFFGLILDFLKRRIAPQLSWWIMLFFIGMVLLAVHVASQNGLAVVLTRFTLVPHTAAYRLVIWEYGSETVRQNPWFGIGYQQWERLAWMGESVDAHFLLLAMRHGLVVPILVMVAAIYAMIRLGMKAQSLAPHDRYMVTGINMALAIMLIAGQTVAFFGASNLVFMSLIACVASLVSAVNQPAQALVRRRVQVRRPALEVGSNGRPVSTSAPVQD